MSVDESRGTPRRKQSPEDPERGQAREEPEFVNEADIPTDDEGPGRAPRRAPARDGSANPNPDVRTPPNADVAGVESMTGEEDPGAALDQPPRSAT